MRKKEKTIDLEDVEFHEETAITHWIKQQGTQYTIQVGVIVTVTIAGKRYALRTDCIQPMEVEQGDEDG